MAGNSRDSLKGFDQDSLDHERPLPTPSQETGGRQVSGRALHRQSQGIKAEIPSKTEMVAEIIAALLVLLFNLPVRSFAIGRTRARTAVQYLQTLPVDVKGRDKMKHDSKEIKCHLKKFAMGKQIEGKGKFHFQDTLSVISLTTFRGRKNSFFLFD